MKQDPQYELLVSQCRAQIEIIIEQLRNDPEVQRDPQLHRHMAISEMAATKSCMIQVLFGQPTNSPRDSSMLLLGMLLAAKSPHYVEEFLTAIVDSEPLTMRIATMFTDVLAQVYEARSTFDGRQS